MSSQIEAENFPNGSCLKMTAIVRKLHVLHHFNKRKVSNYQKKDNLDSTKWGPIFFLTFSEEDPEKVNIPFYFYPYY